MIEIERAVESFKAGGGENIHLLNRRNPSYMRIEGDSVRTSWGYLIPVDAIEVSMASIEEAMLTVTIPEGGIQIGQFKADGIQPNLLKVGCHLFEFAEVRRIFALIRQS